MAEVLAAEAGHASRARQQLDRARAQILEQHRAGAGGQQIVRAISDATDQAIHNLFRDLASEDDDGAPPLALVALGGYGRRELSPKSDIDLLALLPEVEQGRESRRRSERLAEHLHRALWDAGLETGFAARSLPDCLGTAAQDHTIRTALLDCRLVCGDPELFGRLERAAVTELEGKRIEQFIKDKLAEFAERRERFGGSVWLLEPNIKTGKGGLRDLHTALWIARARHKVAGLGEAGDGGLLPARDVDAARAARDWLWRLRNELHYSTGRRDDRLTFDNQRRLAKAFGYKDGEHELGVERLMRETYLAAQQIARAAEALIDRCAVEDAPKPSGLFGWRRSRPRAIDAAFQLVDKRVALTHPDVFERRPADLVRIFSVAETYQAPLHSTARDKLVRALLTVGPQLAADRDAHREVWDLLTREGSDGTALAPLHELGVLGALFPEVERLRARVQHDLYHVYTVDQHTVVALTRLLRLRAGLHAEQVPELSRIARALERPLALALGLFFHDLGKGMGSDHSRRGAELVRAYAERSGLDAGDARDAEWLVAQHLKMSMLSQRRDLEDQAMIAAFAKECGTVERLQMLYVLTYCDMASVSTENWTGWKANLLRTLYEKAARCLESTGLDAPAHAQSLAERRQRLTALLARGAAPALVDEFVQAAPERYLFVTAPETAARHLKLWLHAREHGLAAELLQPPTGEALVTLCAPDKPGLLALFAAALAANGIDILSAEVASLAGGIALDQFHVREPGGGAPAPRRWESARADLARLLAGEDDPRKLVEKRLRRASWAASAAPEVATRTNIDNVSSAHLTVLDVFAQDRPGLLYAIAEALHAAGASIELARVATEGNKATDAFYLRDAGGKLVDEVKLRELRDAVEAGIAEHAQNFG